MADQQGYVKEMVERYHAKSAEAIPNLNFLLIGLAGAGKSTLINNLLKREVATVNDTVQSHSSSVRQYVGDIEGVPVLIFDTPGLGDSRGDFDTSFLSETKTVLDKNDIHVVIYCLKMNETRMSEGLINAFNQFDKIGVDWKKTIFALTFADAVTAPAKVKKAASFEMSAYFSDRLKMWRTEIPQYLASACKADVSNLKINPTTDDADAKLPNGEEWFVPFWLDTVKCLPPGPLTRFLDIHKSNVVCIRNGDQEKDISQSVEFHKKRIVISGRNLEVFEHEVGTSVEKGIREMHLEDGNSPAIKILIPPNAVTTAVIEIYGFK